MKLYSAAPKASISMVTDDRLSRALIQLHQTSPLTHILETGTYVGLGSTRFIAEILASHPPVPQMFVTIEASYSNWRRAKRNLKRFPFVKPLWGLSTSRQDAQNFIESDSALLNHAAYPDIFIDDVKDPVAFYSNEIRGQLGGKSRSPVKRLREIIDRRFLYAGENLLVQWLNQIRSCNPLIVLDSAGAVGYLEFNLVRKQMEGLPYFLLLDDIHHLKHFRSHQDVRSSAQFEMLDENQEAGWMLARHQPA